MEKRDYYLESLNDEQKLYELTIEHANKFSEQIVNRAKAGLKEIEFRKFMYMKMKERENKAPWES